MGKLTKSMAIFNSYVSLPEGRATHQTLGPFWRWIHMNPPMCQKRVIARRKQSTRLRIWPKSRDTTIGYNNAMIRATQINKLVFQMMQTHFPTQTLRTKIWKGRQVVGLCIGSSVITTIYCNRIPLPLEEIVTISHTYPGSSTRNIHIVSNVRVL